MATTSGEAVSGTTVSPLKQTSRADIERFVRVPRSPEIQRLYAPYRDVWTPYTDDTLIRTLSLENPIYEHTDAQMFVASRGGQDVGRALALHNPLSSLTREEGLGFFGFFEADGVETARALLLESAWPWLQKRGLKGIVGNVSPTTNDEVGVLIEGFHRHILLLEFNPPEYPKYLEALGFGKAKDLYGYTSQLDAEHYKELLSGKSGEADFGRIARLLARRAGVTIEYLNKRKINQYAAEFCRMYNRAWADHWGFEPFTSAELLYLAKDLLQLLPNDLLIFVRNKDGEMVGGALCTPDLNQLFRKFDGKMGPIEMIRAVGAMRGPRWIPAMQRPKMLRIIGLGVLPEYERKGAASALMSQVVANGIKSGYTEANISWILEDNDAMLIVPRRFKLTAEQTWRMFAYRPGS
jgi:GNAT superfamily N-acetyltransferase